MPFYADLHVHSKFSRATSRDCDLEHLALWAGKKGVSVVGTGDFTHPGWRAEIEEKLLPAEPGLFRLREDLEREVEGRLPSSCSRSVRFMLQVEISTIYKKGDRTRKVHHLIYVPGFDSARDLVQRLSRIGNLASDGRPILGLDSRDLLEITLESGEGSYLIPAHVWTPWFSALGSRSGFESIEECYRDLAPHIFAIETGLSADPPMIWRVSRLDRFRLVSNSDAHSPPRIGREACRFDTAMDYFAIRRALETGEAYGGTVEFFPEEGKYHLDGHRKCGVRMEPRETRESRGLCPACGGRLTVGVMNRVEQLADRPGGKAARGAVGFRSFVPLPELISEIEGKGPRSQAVQERYERLLSGLGPELFILDQAPTEDVRREGSVLLGEAIARMRRGQVIREAGFDGEYGSIHLFTREELERGRITSLLFDSKEEEPPRTAPPGRPPPPAPKARGGREAPGSLLPGRPGVSGALDEDQSRAARILGGPLLVIAGPGTGKTRTLTHRIAHLLQEGGVAPEACLAITFTRRAAGEMTERLQELLPGAGLRVPVMTFHALGHAILQEHAGLLDLPRPFRVASEGEQTDLIQACWKVGKAKAKRLLAGFSRARRAGGPLPGDDETPGELAIYERALRARALVDFDDLILLAVKLLHSHPDLAARYEERFPWISVDEFQDIDLRQYELIRLLAPERANLCAIGDPDQAIYGFRGGDLRFFQRFQEDYPEARVVHLGKNYRSGATIVDASMQLIASVSAERRIQARIEDENKIVIHESPTDRAEAEFVVRTVEGLIGGSTFFSLDSGRAEGGEGADLSFSDFAVLYRTRNQSNPLCEALARSGMPFQNHSHDRLIEDPAVRALERAMGGLPGKLSVGERLRKAASVLAGSGGDRGHHPAADSLLSLAEDCGDDLDRFRSELETGMEVDLWDPRADRISLLTLHAAKGLEFRVVFIVGCEDGILPLQWGGESDPDEERRLLFVGMTRARDRLFLSHARRRFWRGKVRRMEISPFLKDIEEGLLERRRPTLTRKAPRPEDRQLELF